MRRDDYGLGSLEESLQLHALVWRNLDDRNDPWYKRILNFKNGQTTAIHGARRVMFRVLPHFLMNLNICCHPVGLITALSHDDTSTNMNKPLPILAAALSEQFPHLNWLPCAMEKDTHERRRAGSREERDREVHGKYRCVRLPDNVNSIIVLDDLATGGGTLSEMARAMRECKPNVDIHPIVLGKNIHGNRQDVNNSHIKGFLPDIETIWPAPA